MANNIIIKTKSILKEIRVWQWAKNALVFVPIIFGGKLLDFTAFTNVVFAFFAISFAASFVYVVNDLFDVNEDRNHPIKKHRPLACGDISKAEAYSILFAMLILSILFSIVTSTFTLILVLIYAVLNLLYSKTLKHKEIIDILLVAFFYIYRVYIGGVASGLPLSGWLILTTFFLALFMITGKRRAELITANNKVSYSRKVLNLYNEKFLDAALTLSLTLFIVFYSLYSVLVHNDLFVITIIPVIFISLRYLYLIFAKNDGEEPEKLIFKDREILIAGIVLGIIIIAALYLGASSFAIL